MATRGNRRLCSRPEHRPVTCPSWACLRKKVLERRPTWSSDLLPKVEASGRASWSPARSGVGSGTPYLVLPCLSLKINPEIRLRRATKIAYLWQGKGSWWSGSSVQDRTNCVQGVHGCDGGLLAVPRPAQSNICWRHCVCPGGIRVATCFQTGRGSQLGPPSGMPSPSALEPPGGSKKSFWDVQMR